MPPIKNNCLKNNRLFLDYPSCRFPSNPIIILILLFSCLSFPLTTTSAAADLKPYDRLFTSDPESPWHIQADEILYNRKTNQYHASGNVIIKQLDKSLSADKLVFDVDNMETSAAGNVMLKIGEDVLTASRMELNLSEEQGILYNGKIFLKENHFYIAGEKIQKIEGDAYIVDRAVVTTCDGDLPAWRITGKNLNVSLDGYGVVKHSTLWAKNIPVFYSPLLVFPARQDRQSGLLIPKIAFSDRKGTEYDQPLYWAINQSSDATLFEHYMSDRGDKIGLEYRYVIDGLSKGTMMIDMLHDRKIDDGTGQSSKKWGYEHDDWPRTNSDRYWYRGKLDQSLPIGFFAKLDVDLVSDQDYLIEFRDGYSGFYATEHHFTRDFGRILDSYDDPVRSNRLNINKTGTNYSLNADLKWYDDVIARRYLDQNTALQKLPQIGLNTLRQSIPSTPFYWVLDSNYTYFFSEDGTNGHRTDIHPRIYLPYHLKPYFYFEPSLGFRETIWQIETFQDIPQEKNRDHTHFRHVYDVQLNLSSEISRVYSVKSDRINAVRHTILPQIVYDYIPETNQDEYPWFNDLKDSINRIEKTNLITCAVTQFLTSRSEIAVDKPIEDDDKERLGDTKNIYHQLLRFKLQQSYDINEARSDTPANWRNRKDKRPFFPLEAELELILTDFLSILADAKWSYYESNFLTRNIELRLRDSRGDRLYIDYRFADGMVESFSADVTLKLTDRLSSYADYERNIFKGETIQTSLGFLYEAQCWSMKVRFKDETDDQKIELMMSLKGLGGIGND